MKSSASSSSAAADLRVFGWLLLAWAINAAVFWLSVELVGGSAFFSDIPHGVPPFIQIGYERVEVSRFVHELSYWHGFSVFLSAAWLILIAGVVAAVHALTWLRSALPVPSESCWGVDRDRP